MAALIGGNTLSPFYSTAVLIPYSTSTVAPTGMPTVGVSIPFCRAVPHRKRGLVDVTHSWYPQTRGVRQTQVTFDFTINVFLNPDGFPEESLDLANSPGGYQLFLSFGVLANYPTVDQAGGQRYFWVPSVFIESLPHKIDVQRDPAEPIAYDLSIRSNAPAFFLPHDAAMVTSFITYITTPPLNWAF